MHHKSFVALILLLIFVSARPGQAQDRPLKKIRWGVTAITASQWLPWLAKEAKLYEKHGLEVELILLRGSGQSSQALLGGSIFAAPVAFPTVLNADLGGADFVIVAHTVSGVRSRLMVKPEIKRPEDLRGRKLGVSSFGSQGDFLTRSTLRKYGLDPSKDVIILALGNIPERVQALLTGVVDAVDLNHPGDVMVMRNGFKALWDLRKEVNYPSMSVVTRRKSVKEDRETVVRMVKAHIEAIHFLKANKDFSLKVLGKYLRMNDRELLEEAYSIYKEDFISVPRPILQGHEATYEYVAQQRPEILKHKPEEFMDPSIIAELEKAGFFKELAATYR